jgi:hypothetical protein
MKTNDDYCSFTESERHFNETQAGIRNHAATWMLAAFAAIAILLKSEEKVNWLVSPAVLVGVVSVMATLGLLALWINEQLVYQRLLDCGFIIALKMDYDNPRLPPIRAMMMYSAEGKGMACWITYFYTIPMWRFLAISVATTLLRRSIGSTREGVDWNRSLILLIVLCVAQSCATLWVQWKKADVRAATRAALFVDKAFATMFDGTNDACARVAKVIERHRLAAATEGGTVK